MPELVKSGRRVKLVDVCSPLDLHKSNQPRSKGTSRDALLTFTCIYRFVDDALVTTRRASCQLGWIRLSRKFYQKLRGGGAKGRNFDEIFGRSEARRRALPYADTRCPGRQFLFSPQQIYASAEPFGAAREAPGSSPRPRRVERSSSSRQGVMSHEKRRWSTNGHIHRHSLMWAVVKNF